MGKQSRAKKEVKRETPPPAVPRATPNRALFALAVLGILLTSYLSWTAFYGANVKGCSVGGGCDIVLTSKWAKLFGLPTSFWGLLTYLTLAATAFFPRAENRWRLGWVVALVGLTYSVYLTTISLTMLHATCPYCLTSLTLMTAIFALLTYQRPSSILNFSWRPLLTFTVPPALVLILALHMNYVGVLGEPPEEEDAYARALASHLADAGVKFYGASWCPHCQEQKAIFGPSASRLPYIECSPGGQGSPQAQVCRDAKIQTYPTWMIKGQRIEEVMSLQRLAQSSGFQMPPGQ